MGRLLKLHEHSGQRLCWYGIQPVPPFKSTYSKLKILGKVKNCTLLIHASVVQDRTLIKIFQVSLGGSPSHWHHFKNANSKLIINGK